MSLTGLPVLLRLAGRPVILLGEGPAAEAKRRLLERAGAVITTDAEAAAALAIVAIEDDGAAQAAIERLRIRGILVNAVDRPALCDVMLPAIVDRDPVLVAISTGGASAGLAAALRQRVETLLPSQLGTLADALRRARDTMRERWPSSDARRRALGQAFAAGGALDPLVDHGPDAVAEWLEGAGTIEERRLVTIDLRSDDPDDLTLREARWLAQADRIYHLPDVPPAILDRTRADAERIATARPPATLGAGLSVMIGRAG